jgi:hypothetical protein
MSEPCTVIIGAQQYLDALLERARSNGGGEVLAFNDADALRALDTITKRKPGVVTLERLYAASPRGAALISRIKADPSLASVEIHIASHDGSYSRVSPRRSPPDATTVAPAAPVARPPEPQLDWRGTRRAPRFRMKDNTELQVDGSLAKVVDLSAIGAQIVSKSALRPQQRLRITLADDLGVVRFSAAVAWASFEIPKGTTRYRAGVEFKGAEPSEVEAFARRHKSA